MHPARELRQLALRKQLLQARIDLHRLECALAASKLATPVAMVDAGLTASRRLSPLVRTLGIPAGLFLVQWLRTRAGNADGGKQGKLASILSALPALLQGMKMTRGLF